MTCATGFCNAIRVLICVVSLPRYLSRNRPVYDGRAHGLSVQNHTNLPDTLSLVPRNREEALQRFGHEVNQLGFSASRPNSSAASRVSRTSSQVVVWLTMQSLSENVPRRSVDEMNAGSSKKMRASIFRLISSRDFSPMTVWAGLIRKHTIPKRRAGQEFALPQEERRHWIAFVERINEFCCFNGQPYVFVLELRNH